MLIAQISDTHVQLPGGLLDRNYDTAGNLERAVRHLNAFTPQPDAVLLTGDAVDAGLPAEYGRLREILSVLKAPLFVIPGNHDEREAMRRAFSDGRYLPGEGFLQYTIEDWPVRLIGLDTLIPGEHGGRLCDARRQWLAAQLDQARDRPTVIFMHHPPFRTGLTVMDAMGFEGAEALASLVRSQPQVHQVVSGHIHRPIVTRFGGTVASVCPSTAQQAALDLRPDPHLAVVMEPPAATLLWWDSTTGSLVHHLSVIGERPAHVLYDGSQWVMDNPLPPGFHA
ncbi:MAG: phosphodiesterase [Gammaproteobacteria bacterium]|nr:phosphodiesterase [Gammaproteobacteria bacterium]